MNHKLKRQHIQRKALVYLRQSTQRQVLENRESTARQYALTDRAKALGWSDDAIEVLDDDLGYSGATATWRPGFQRMAEMITRGEVGALLALDVSRFARCSADWHRLLELCHYTEVLIIDEQGIFDPADPNDRLLLGFKGQMSEAEKNWLKLRMNGARLNKARRGELWLRPPTGYQWDPDLQRLRFDPDEAVQESIRLLFRRFRIDCSAQAVTRYFTRHELRFPVRRVGDTQTRWVQARAATLRGILHNPTYAGTYVYGRRENRTLFEGGQVRRTRVVQVPQSEWKVCLHDHHPGYITWEDYMNNRRQLRSNTTHQTTTGATRKGPALLQGLLLCGRCGAKMKVQYSGGHTHYACERPRDHSASPRCWMLAGWRIDRAVVEQFLEAAQPPTVDLSLAVAREVNQQAEALKQQWQLRLERVQYEARLAERRYLAVDPENRTVARTLEARWEQSLVALRETERGLEVARRSHTVTLTPRDYTRIQTLAADLSLVWSAETTNDAERKVLLRTLIAGVTLTPLETPMRSTRVQIAWIGGAVTEVHVARPRRVGRRSTPEVDARIRSLVGKGLSDPEVAESLNDEGLQTVTGRRWGHQSIYQVRKRLSLAAPNATRHPGPVPDRREDGLYSKQGVARHFGVSEATVLRWVRAGWLPRVVGGKRGRRSWYRLDETIEAFLLTRSRKARAQRSAKQTSTGVAS